MAYIRALHDYHSWIIAQRPCQLAMPNVHRVDPHCAALEQHVGESPRRSAYIYADITDGVEVKCDQRALQLEAASADKSGLAGGGCQLDGGIRGDERARFQRHLASDTHLTRHDERPCSFSAWRKSTRH